MLICRHEGDCQMTRVQEPQLQVIKRTSGIAMTGPSVSWLPIQDFFTKLDWLFQDNNKLNTFKSQFR